MGSPLGKGPCSTAVPRDLRLPRVRSAERSPRVRALTARPVPPDPRPARLDRGLIRRPRRPQGPRNIPPGPAPGQRAARCRSAKSFKGTGLDRRLDRRQPQAELQVEVQPGLDRSRPPSASLSAPPAACAPAGRRVAPAARGFVRHSAALVREHRTAPTAPTAGSLHAPRPACGHEGRVQTGRSSTRPQNPLGSGHMSGTSRGQRSSGLAGPLSGARPGHS